jgi:hypothetical protein
VPSLTGKMVYNKIYAYKGKIAQAKYGNDQYTEEYYKRSIGLKLKKGIYFFQVSVGMYNPGIGGY